MATQSPRDNQRIIRYQDGSASVYHEIDRKRLQLKQKHLHYKEATVGERRYWDAYVAGTRITRAIYVPYDADVDYGDIVIINGLQYQVVQKDFRDNVRPTSWLLSLHNAPIKYTEVEA